MNPGSATAHSGHHALRRQSLLISTKLSVTATPAQLTIEPNQPMMGYVRIATQIVLEEDGFKETTTDVAAVVDVEVEVDEATVTTGIHVDTRST